MVQRALIVEDEPLIAIDLEATLRTLGFDVCGRASNPREAVELATSRQPDFILMDVYLDEGRQGSGTAPVTGPSSRSTAALFMDLPWSRCLRKSFRQAGFAKHEERCHGNDDRPPQSEGLWPVASHV